jgi:hypothetical protein
LLANIKSSGLQKISSIRSNTVEPFSGSKNLIDMTAKKESREKNEIDLFYENTTILVTGGNGVGLVKINLNRSFKRIISVSRTIFDTNSAAMFRCEENLFADTLKER